MPADADFEDFDAKIAEVRAARATDDPKKYAAALRSLIAAHYDSFDASESYSGDTLRDLVKRDRLLADDNMSMAIVAGVFHNKNRSGTSPKNLDQAIQDARQNFIDKRADIRPIMNALGGDWDTPGVAQMSKDMEQEFHDEFIRQGAHEAEATVRAKRKVISILNTRSSDPKQAYFVISSKSQNASIKLYMDGKSSTMKPVIGPDDAVRIREGIAAARALRFNKDPINVNVMSNDSMGVPKAVSDELESGDVAFTYFGGDGVYLYPEKIQSEFIAGGFGPNWFSTDTPDVDSIYKHLIVHETGHLQMYKLWGSENSSGRQALEADFKKFNVRKNGTSDYGNESISESFAEQYAKYLLTGDASQEFIDLLSSKGLTKAQLNKKWRETYEQKDSNYKGFFDFMDKFMGSQSIDVDGKKITAPEYDFVWQQSGNQPYGTKQSKFGSAPINLIARLKGMRNKKPETVTSIQESDKVAVVYRGVDGTKGKSGWDLHDEWRTSDEPWYGFGMFGDGQYSSNLQSSAGQFGSTIAKMGIKKDAKVAVWNDNRSSTSGWKPMAGDPNAVNLYEIYNELTDSVIRDFILNEIDPDMDSSEISQIRSLILDAIGLRSGARKDASNLAAILGYQVLEILEPQAATRGREESYFIIIDRSATQMMVPPGKN